MARRAAPLVCERREWDSNPRSSRLPVFKTGAFNPSAIPPDGARQRAGSVYATRTRAFASEIVPFPLTDRIQTRPRPDGLHSPPTTFFTHHTTLARPLLQLRPYHGERASDIDIR